MEKTDRQSGGYIRTPMTLVLWGVPRLEIAEASGNSTSGAPKTARRLMMGGVSTLPTTINSASARAEALLRACKHAVRARDFSKLVELLDEQPWFAYHPWVQETVRRFGDHPRFKRKPGRRRRSKVDPLVVVALANALLESRRVRSRERAFGLLEEWELISSKTAERLYRHAYKDKRFRAVLIRLPGMDEYVSEKEANTLRKHSEQLLPFQRITRSFEDAERGSVDISLDGLEAGPPTKDFFLVTSVSLFGPAVDNN